VGRRSQAQRYPERPGGEIRAAVEGRHPNVALTKIEFWIAGMCSRRLPWPDVLTRLAGSAPVITIRACP
jgi:hypothetical protein